MPARAASSRVRDAVVVGAGVAGCTAAFELARRGLSVVLVEQRTIAAGASGRNMGLLLNEVDVEAYELMRAALTVYDEIKAGPVPFALRETDMMLVPQDRQQLDVTRRRADALRAHGLDCVFVPEEELRAQLPQLREGLPGGYRVPGVWMVDPAAATRAFAEAARGA